MMHTSPRNGPKYFWCCGDFPLSLLKTNFWQEHDMRSFCPPSKSKISTKHTWTSTIAVSISWQLFAACWFFWEVGCWRHWPSCQSSHCSLSTIGRRCPGYCGHKLLDCRPTLPGSVSVSDVCQYLSRMSHKRWWGCIGLFEDKFWGFLGHPCMVMSDFWGRQTCSSWCSGKPGRPARWNIDVQIASITHFLMRGAKNLPEAPLQLMSICPDSTCQCCKWLEEGDALLSWLLSSSLDYSFGWCRRQTAGSDGSANWCSQENSTDNIPLWWAFCFWFISIQFYAASGHKLSI